MERNATRPVHRQLISSSEIDDGWTLSPEIETLLSKPLALGLGQRKPNASAKVDLNSASVEELCALPGIGRSRAKQIVLWRRENGPFKSPTALLAISGIGSRTIEALTPRLTSVF